MDNAPQCPKMKQTIFTIGYAGFSIDGFIRVLNDNKINAVIDVRSNPVSSYWSDFDAPALKSSLIGHKIYYQNLSEEFGARQTNTAYFDDRGFLSFKKYSQSDAFQKGMKRIQKGMNSGYNVVLMCAEKDPSRCHRTILISKAFNDLGMNVIHLLIDGSRISQSDLEEKLLNEYFPNRHQLSLLDSELSDDVMRSLIYEKRNEEIGFRTGDESQ